jgi:hypothetical protein
MLEIDDELVARAIDWCSEAHRSASADEIRTALSRLSWDELLAVRAVLADPPPTHPLGPLALIDLARGTAPELAAERERRRCEIDLPPLCSTDPERIPLARGRSEGEDSHRPDPRLGAEPPAPTRKKGKCGPAGPVIRRARDRVKPESRQLEPLLPLVDDLFASEGRTVLERLIRQHGARRARIAAALANGWRRADGTAPGEEELSRLLDLHGLARGFESRERDELLHALRAAAGLRTRAAHAVGVAPAAFDTALERLGARDEADSIRAAHRNELRRRATLSERVRMLLGETERLADLDLLAEIEADVRARIPQLVRALRPSRAVPLAMALARSLAVESSDIDALVLRLALDLGERRAPQRAPSPSRDRPPRPPRDERGPPRDERGPPRVGRGPQRVGRGPPRDRDERPERAHGQDRPRRGETPAARDRPQPQRGDRPSPRPPPPSFRRSGEGGTARPRPTGRGQSKGTQDAGRPRGPKPGGHPRPGGRAGRR